MKYAIFGGSFDPPHLGHEAIAEVAMDQMELDEVLWVPANRNPLKDRHQASPQDRLRMVQLVIEDEPRYSMSDIEITRSGRSYSIDTVSELALVRPGTIWWILGADALAGITKWKSVEKLVRICRFAVVSRPGTDTEKVLGTIPDWIRSCVDEVRMPGHRASSTEIRESINLGKSPEIWLNPTVWAYIQSNNLYKT